MPHASLAVPWYKMALNLVARLQDGMAVWSHLMYLFEAKVMWEFFGK